MPAKQPRFILLRLIGAMGAGGVTGAGRFAGKSKPLAAVRWGRESFLALFRVAPWGGFG